MNGRLKRLGKPIAGAGFPHEYQGASNGDLPFYKVSDFNLPGNERDLRTSTNWVSRDVAEKLGATVVPAGTVLMPKIGAALLGNERRLCAEPAVFDNNVMGIVPKDQTDSRYLYYLLCTLDMAAISNPGPVPSVGEGVIGSLVCPIPTLSTQQAVAARLEAETAPIDQLIDKNLQMTTLLEARLGLVAYALTVDNVGQKVALRHLVRQVKTGTTPSADKMEALTDGEVPWYSPGDVEESLRLGDAARWLRAEAVQDGWVPLFPADSTLVVGIGSAGRVAHLDRDATGNQQMTCIVSGPRLLPRFLSWQLFARSDELRATAPSTTMPILTNDFLRALSIVVPQTDRQAQAVKRLDAEAARTRLVTTRIRNMVRLLLERRVALITAAVMGRVGVLPGV